MRSLNVSGNFCPRGAAYGKQEVTNPDQDRDFDRSDLRRRIAALPREDRPADPQGKDE
jgi:hypothetical protein